MFTKRSLRERGLRDSNKSGEQLTLPEIRGKATIEENEPYPITETCFWGGGRGEITSFKTRASKLVISL